MDRNDEDSAVAWLQSAYASEHLDAETARALLTVYLAAGAVARETHVDPARGIRPFECVGVAQPFTLPQLREFVGHQDEAMKSMTDEEFARHLPSVWPEAIAALAGPDLSADVRALLDLANVTAQI